MHHGSLDRDVRLQVEDRLKNGELRAVVCSSSLEMGVDIGAIDLVVMISAPKGISRTLQRIGRSGHAVDATSHGILVATNIDDLVECTVTAHLARERRLDAVRIPENAADVLAQHLLGLAMEEPGIAVETAWETVRRAWGFRHLDARISTAWWNTCAAGGVRWKKRTRTPSASCAWMRTAGCGRFRAGWSAITSSTSAPSRRRVWSA